MPPLTEYWIEATPDPSSVADRVSLPPVAEADVVGAVPSIFTVTVIRAGRSLAAVPNTIEGVGAVSGDGDRTGVVQHLTVVDLVGQVGALLVGRGRGELDRTLVPATGRDRGVGGQRDLRRRADRGLDDALAVGNHGRQVGELGLVRPGR